MSYWSPDRLGAGRKSRLRPHAGLPSIQVCLLPDARCLDFVRQRRLEAWLTRGSDGNVQFPARGLQYRPRGRRYHAPEVLPESLLPGV